jgi:membrane protein YdbS with pleckstrin-like domain
VATTIHNKGLCLVEKEKIMDKKQHLQNIREAYSEVNRTRIERNTSGYVFFMWLILWAMTTFVNYQFLIKEYWGSETLGAIVVSAVVQTGAIGMTVIMYKEWDNAIEEHYYATRDFNRLTYGMEI